MNVMTLPDFLLSISRVLCETLKGNQHKPILKLQGEIGIEMLLLQN